MISAARWSAPGSLGILVTKEYLSTWFTLVSRSLVNNGLLVSGMGWQHFSRGLVIAHRCATVLYAFFLAALLGMRWGDQAPQSTLSVGRSADGADRPLPPVAPRFAMARDTGRFPWRYQQSLDNFVVVARCMSLRAGGEGARRSGYLEPGQGSLPTIRTERRCRRSFPSPGLLQTRRTSPRSLPVPTSIRDPRFKRDRPDRRLLLPPLPHCQVGDAWSPWSRWRMAMADPPAALETLCRVLSLHQTPWSLAIEESGGSRQDKLPC